MPAVLLVSRNFWGGRGVKCSPERFEESGVTRRTFLRGLGLGSAGGAIATLLPKTTASAATTTTFKHVWRLSHEGEQACTACRRHSRHRYFRLPLYAKHGRAHHGCNCDVVRQLLSVRKWNKFFVRRDGTLRRRWDTRWTTR